MSDDTKPTETVDTKPTETPIIPESDKKIAELEKKLGEVSSFMTDADAYIKTSSVVIDVLDKDPELKSAFQSKLKALYGEGTGQQPQQGPQTTTTPPVSQTQTTTTDPRVNDLTATQLKTIVTDFEKEAGIINMSESEAKEARQKIEAYMNTFGASVKTTPLPYLRDALQKAYIGVTADKMREEGKLEGFAQARANQNGVMGSFAGTAPRQGESKKVISDKQAEWIKRLRVDPEKAKKTMTQDDQDRVPPFEKR